MSDNDYKAERLEVEGMVQGVGFRPFVHSLAERYSLGGYVANTPDGVLIEIEGPSAVLDAFVRDLEQLAPPLSRIVSITRKPVSTPPPRLNRGVTRNRLYNGFEIRQSVRGHPGSTGVLIPPDICICGECLAELFDPQNRRYLYPFINCTNCGPRFTIIRGLPYDRPLTTMAGFTMCPECSREYTSPPGLTGGSRRFHAQPNACPVCGPRVSLVDSGGEKLPGDPVVTAIDLLRKGRIVAVKGLGGFHLAVDGTDNGAVMRLRRRKNREEKPLALMVGTLTDARRLIAMGRDEEQILTSRERPILLAPRAEHEHGEPPVAETVAPRNPQLGVMLPYTPLHYLLFFHPAAGGDFLHARPVFSALVMTSGNLSEEPVCKDNDEVLERLAGVADAFLLHDRGIHVRCDDSVVRSTNGNTMFIRRSRGFVPVPVFLLERSVPVLALGGELKNTLCLIEGRRAFMSQHIGDLENIPTLAFFREAVTHFTGIFNLEPAVFAYDLHPEYLSTKYIMSLRDSLDPDRYGLVGIQHHHAHIAGVMAEHGVSDPVIGFSMDGTGYGVDGTVWGGEVLLCTPVAFTRAAHLDTVPMPGGSSAVREPWRMAFSNLREAFGDEVYSLDLPCLKRIPPEHLEVLARACDTGLNCPRTSSLGRLFDAAASILDIRHETAFEGQAAMELEMYATGESDGMTLPYEILPDDTEPLTGAPVLWGTAKSAAVTEKPLCETSYTIDFRPLVRALVEELRHGKPRSVLALSFHIAILSSFLDVAERIRETTGIATAALSGGCWQNRILSERFQSMLRDRSFTVLTHRQVPPNDGGIALGQAYVASHICRLNTKEESPCALQYP